MERNVQFFLRSPCVTKRNFQFRKLIEREGFGSFHSEDVEKLIRLPKIDFKVPPICNQIAAVPSTTEVARIPFGKQL